MQAKFVTMENSVLQFVKDLCVACNHLQPVTKDKFLIYKVDANSAPIDDIYVEPLFVSSTGLIRIEGIPDNYEPFRRFSINNHIKVTYNGKDYYMCGVSCVDSGDNGFDSVWNVYFD